MLGFLNKGRAEAYALLRIMSGFMFSFHGAGKLFGLFSDFTASFGTQMWFGGLIELFGGLCVMLGFLVRPAAFLASGTMAVAYFQFHWKFQGGRDFFPTVNRGEMAVLYCFIFLLIACSGPGKWSLGKKD